MVHKCPLKIEHVELCFFFLFPRFSLVWPSLILLWPQLEPPHHHHPTHFLRIVSPPASFPLPNATTRTSQHRSKGERNAHDVWWFWWWCLGVVLMVVHNRVVFGGGYYGFVRKDFLQKKKKSYNLWRFLITTSCDLIFLKKYVIYGDF